MSETNASLWPVRDRDNVPMIVVEPDPDDRGAITIALKDLGFNAVKVVDDHAEALKILYERRFTHMIFCAEQTSMTAKDFLGSLFKSSPDIIAIPTSADPKGGRCILACFKMERKIL